MLPPRPLLIRCFPPSAHPFMPLLLDLPPPLHYIPSLSCGLEELLCWPRTGKASSAAPAGTLSLGYS